MNEITRSYCSICFSTSTKYGCGLIEGKTLLKLFTLSNPISSLS